MPPHEPPPASDAASPKKPKRWWRRLLIVAAVLLVLGFLLNGPLGRTILHSVLNGQLEKIGLTGDFSLHGTLVGGYTLRDGHWTASEGPIRVLKFTEVALDYRLPDLLDKEIDRLAVRDLELVLAPTAKENTGPPRIEFPRDTLDLVRSLAMPVEIDLENASVQLLRPDAEPLRIALGSLSHAPDSPTFKITDLSSNALGERGLPTQDLTLEWNPDSLGLTRFTILPSLAVESADFSYPAGAPAEAQLTLKAADSELDLQLDESGSAVLTLEGNPLDIESVLAELPYDIPVKGTITSLSLDVANLLATKEAWQGELEFEARDLQWQDYHFQRLTAQGSIADEVLSLTAAVGPEEDLLLTVATPMPDFQAEQPLANHRATFTISAASLEKVGEAALHTLGTAPEDAPSLPGGSLSANGSVLLGPDAKLAEVSAEWQLDALTYEGQDVPDLQGTSVLRDETITANIGLLNPAEEEKLAIDGTFDLSEQTYTGQLDLSFPDTAWIRALIPGDPVLWKPTDGLALIWSGSGNLSDQTHQGTTTVTQLGLGSPGESTTSIALAANYDWPKAVNLETLELSNGDLQLNGSLTLQDEVLTIPGITLADADGELLRLSGTLPAPLEARTLEDVLEVDSPLDLKLLINDLQSDRVMRLVPAEIPSGYSAVLRSDLTIRGTVAEPTISGTLGLDQLAIPDPAGVPPATVELTFATVERDLNVEGRISEPNGRVLDLEGTLPLAVRAWAEDPDTFMQANFQARGYTEEFNIERLVPVVPQLKDLTGVFNLDLRASGTIEDPQLAGEATIDLQSYPLPASTPFRKVGQSSVKLRMEGTKIFLDPSTVRVAGGSLTLSGQADIDPEDPSLDLRVNGDHVLLWRNEDFIARANCSLTIAGTLEKSLITGTVEIVDSLFYKDIEIIPIGVPRTSIPEPQLPQIDTAEADPFAAVPEPFRNWELDLRVRSRDPFLIRGNRAEGEVHVDARITGTLGAPRPDGTIRLEDVEAALPFSTLNVRRGTIKLRPDQPLDPVLEIRGTSNVNRTQVDMLVYGSVSNPRYTLTSNPPLPENEILTLLATGATTGDLEDPSAASLRAFQLMLDEIRRRAVKPGGNKAFADLMEALSDVELQVGENDPFSGRRFNSATLELTDRFYLSAGVDGEGNTRGTIIYSLRFR